MANPPSHETVYTALRAARSIIPLFPEGPARQTVHDALRVIAAACGLPLAVPAKPDLAAPGEHPHTALERHLEAVTGLVQHSLPERRDWIYQNAVALLKEALPALAPRPVKRTHPPKVAVVKEPAAQEEGA